MDIITPCAQVPCAALLHRAPVLQAGCQLRVPPWLPCPQPLLLLCSIPSWDQQPEYRVPSSRAGSSSLATEHWDSPTLTSHDPLELPQTPCLQPQPVLKCEGPGSKHTPSSQAGLCVPLQLSPAGLGCLCLALSLVCSVVAHPSDSAASTLPSLPAGSVARAEHLPLPPAESLSSHACVSHGNSTVGLHVPWASTNCSPAQHSCTLSSHCSQP